MKTLNTIARLVVTVAATALTLALFSSVVALAEPQRSVLLAQTAAKQQAQVAQNHASASVVVAGAH
jgi:hypothetical protein